MQVKFNTNINQSRPNFKASFDNTPETKKALKSIAKGEPDGVLQTLEALERIPDKDVFSVSQGSAYNKFNIINETLAKESRKKSVEYDTSRYDGFLNTIAKMYLSSGDSVGRNLPARWHDGYINYNDGIDWWKGTVAKLNKKDNANFILEQLDINEKEIEKIENKIEKLKSKEMFLRKKENNLLQHYAESVIDSL